MSIKNNWILLEWKRDRAIETVAWGISISINSFESCSAWILLCYNQTMFSGETDTYTKYAFMTIVCK